MKKVTFQPILANGMSTNNMISFKSQPLLGFVHIALFE